MRAAARALYRSRQFLEALRPRIDAELQAQALLLLREPERRLFATMTMRDQQHCLEVYGRLLSQGHGDPDLLAAALLHDVGKGRIAVWHRVAYVLLEAWAPGLLDRLAVAGEGPGQATARSGGWREALYRCRHHQELGAKLAREAGASDHVVALIRGEELGAKSGHLVALQTADDAA